MSTTNPVNQVLVTSGNQGILAAGSRPSALAIGQLGIFNYHTGLSLDASSPVGDINDFFIAVGIDPFATGSKTDIRKSAGQLIQRRNVRAYTLGGYKAAVPEIQELNGYSAKCDTSYAIKIEFRNQKIYRQNGYNQFSKTYAYKTRCCADDCATCGEGDCNELAVGLVNNVNSDLDALVTAALYTVSILATVNGAPTSDANTVVTIGSTTYTVAVLDADTATQAAAKIVAQINTQEGSPYYASSSGANITVHPKVTATGDTTTISVLGAGVTMNAISTTTAVVAVDDVEAFEAAYPGVCLAIRFTGTTQTVPQYNSVNTAYFAPRGTSMIISLVDGFTCNGVVTKTQSLVLSEGEGYDIRHLEYIAGGWNGNPGPYRTSPSTQLAKDIIFFASQNVNYNVYTLKYDQYSVAGWGEHLNNLETVIAIPCADTTTLTGLATVLDGLLGTLFTAMANDAALLDCTNAATNTLTPATDGIEALS